MAGPTLAALRVHPDLVEFTAHSQVAFVVDWNIDPEKCRKPW